MLKPIINLALIVLFAAGGTACTKKAVPVRNSGELTEVQKSELRGKALANYKKLVDKYPDSENVDKAKERIQTLTPPGAKK